MTDSNVLYIRNVPDWLHMAVKVAATEKGQTVADLVIDLLKVEFGTVEDTADYVTIGFVPFAPDPAHEVECDDCQTVVGERSAFLAIDSQLRPRRVVCGDCRDEWGQVDGRLPFPGRYSIGKVHKPAP